MRSCRTLAVVALLGCGRGHHSPDPADVEQPRGPSPTSSAGPFQIGDEVALVDDEGTFSIDARVMKIGGELVRVIEPGPTHFDPIGWIPVGEAATLPREARLTGKERHAPNGYQLLVGGGRMRRWMWFPATQVFPVPWAGRLTAGETVVKPRTGESAPSSCVVKEAPVDPHLSVTVRCDGERYGEPVAREALVRALEPVTVATLAPGALVYVDNEQWAIVIGASGADAVVRETGVAARDKVVAVSRVRLAR